MWSPLLCATLLRLPQMMAKTEDYDFVLAT